MSEDQTPDTRPSNLIDVDFVKKSESRGTKRRANRASKRAAEEREGLVDAGNLNVLDKVRREHLIAVERFDDGRTQITMRPKRRDTVSERIAAARSMGPQIDYLASKMTYTGKDGKQYRSVAALVLAWEAVCGEERPEEVIIDQVNDAIPRARAWKASGYKDMGMVDEIVACFPQLADYSPRSREMISYDLNGRVSRGKESLLANVDLDELRALQVDPILEFVEALQPVLTEAYGTRGGRPVVELLASVCLDGRVTPGPISQEYPADYRSIRKGVDYEDLPDDERRLVDRMIKGHLTPITHDGKEWSVGWNLVRVTIPELHLCVWEGLVPAGDTDRWWNAARFDVDDPESPKCKTESDAAIEFGHFWAGLAADYTDEGESFPLPRRIYADGSLSNKRVHLDMHNRFSMKVVSPPSQGTLNAHRNRELNQLFKDGALTIEDFSEAELKRVQKDNDKSPATLLREGKLSAFSDAELDRLAAEKQIRPYGRDKCVCGRVPQARESSDFPTLQWREKHGVAWGEDISQVTVAGSKARRFRSGSRCPDCDRTYLHSFRDNPLEFPGVPHEAQVLHIADAASGKRPLDKLSAERTALTGGPFSRRESWNNSSQRNGFGNEGTDRCMWGHTFLIRQVMLILNTAYSNALQLVHPTGVYADIVAARQIDEEQAA